VTVHDLAVSPWEGLWAAVPGQRGESILHGFFFEALDWIRGGIYEPDSGHYVGDAYTDLLFAADRLLRDELCPLGSTFNLDGVLEWAFVDGTNVTAILSEFRCGSDIQSHAAKGTIGIRVDGVKQLSMRDVVVERLTNRGDLGTDLCGEYDAVAFTKGFGVDSDIQYGFCGNNVHGILVDYASGSFENVAVRDLESWTGSAVGIAIHKGTTAEFGGQIAVDRVAAGTKLTQSEADELTLPNALPFVCSLYIGPNSEEETDEVFAPIINAADTLSLRAGPGFYGFDRCEGSSRMGDMPSLQSPGKFDGDRGETFVVDGDGHLNFAGHYRLIVGSVVSTILVVICFLCHDQNRDGILKTDSTRYGSFR